MFARCLIVDRVVQTRLYSPSSRRTLGMKFFQMKGKLPGLDGWVKGVSSKDIRQLLENIPTESITGLRDRALLEVLIYSFARVVAVVAMDVEDCHQSGRQGMFRLHEKGGKEHLVPAHRNAEEYIEAYVDILVIVLKVG